VRNLGLIVAIWLAAIVPTQALALGLGEIEVKSFLNQPLEAEIEVISARPGEIDDLLVSLASREAFARAGLSRPRHLSDLRFSVSKNEAGDEAVILVTTKDGVKEPFLNFLIEADWAKGRVLREFTILLDPPFYAEQPPPVETPSQPVAAPIADDASVADIAQQMGVTETAMPEPEASGSGQQFSEPIALADDSAPQQGAVEQPTAEPVEESSSFQFVLDTPQQNLADEVLVAKGNTLWSIASRYRDDAHSMSQIMLAFQRANPAAFNDGNINNMREGAILRVPDAAELDALDAQQAYAEVLVQNGLWDEYVARVTGVSPAAAVDQGETTEVTGSISVSDAPSGELSLLMPAEGSGDTAGTGDGSELGNLRNRLAMAEEELEASRIENRELETRISELQARLSKMEELQKMVEIEDDSLAQLQADAAAQQSSAAVSQQPEEVELPVEETFSGDGDAGEQALIEELLAEEAAAQAEEQATTMAANDGMVDDEVAMADPGSAGAGDSMAEDQMAGGAAGETQGNQQSTPPAPVIITETAVREPSIFDGILPPEVIEMIPSMPVFDLPLPSLGGIFSNPLTLGALGGVVVLLLLLLLYRRKKNETESDSTITASNDEDLFVDDDHEELTPIHLDDAEAAEDSIIGAGVSEERLPSSEQSMAPSEAVSVAEPQADDFAATAIISAADVPQPEAPSAVAPDEQDDVLNEVDVYLAYGLYDNAEELLTSNLAANPDRADYRSKLLDTYFATKNTAGFVKEAETLKSMGAAADRFWDRVQVMGYELAPDNPLFSAAKDSGMSAADLEISKPQEADFDLGASGGEDTSFSTTDFNLGEDETGGQVDDGDVAATQVIQQVEDMTDLGDDLPDLGDVSDIAPTQVVQQVGGTVELSDDDDTNLNRQSVDDDFSLDLSDEAGEELEFSMDEGTGGEGAGAGGDLDLSMDFDIDDEVTGGDSGEFSLDDATSTEDPSEFNLGDDLAASIGDDEEAAAALGLDLEDETGGDAFIEETAVISADFDAGEFEVSEEESADGDLGLGIDETGVLDLDDFDSPLDDTDDDDDISIVDFGGEDFEEPTALVDSIDDLDDSLSIDVDIEDDDDEVKTGTFSPGDFDEPTAIASPIDDLGDLGDLDDMDDLMLPDDVDEVSTKLDLARAFIDMGDNEGARGSLEEVLAEGNEAQKQEAQALLEQI
jgi:pilus assembly protein FimV